MPASTDVLPGFTVLPHMIDRMRRVGRQMAWCAASVDEHERWRQAVRQRLAELTGLDTMTRCAPEPAEDEPVECDGYTRTRLVLRTEPGVSMPLFVLRPTGMEAAERRPAVICCHGHSSGGKAAVVGMDDDPQVARAIEEFNYAFGVRLAQMGMIAFCPDARGFGERREAMARRRPDSILQSSCQYINQMAMPLGQTVTGMWTWDLLRLVDYIQSRPDCDADRLGCVGLSGGGLQTLWLTAMDERVRAAVVSGYFYGYEQSLLVQHNNCSCNYVPRLFEHVDMGDIAALAAPRALLVETGDQDQLNGRDGLGNVISQVDIARRAYRLLGAEDRIEHVVFAGGHRFDGKRSLPWLERQLRAGQGG